MKPIPAVLRLAIRYAQQNNTGATAMASIANPSRLGSNTSTRRKRGKAASTNKSVAPLADFAACSIVASRAVTTPARIVAVTPLGQLARIQNVPTRITAVAARNPAQEASMRSLETQKRGRRGDWGRGKAKA